MAINLISSKGNDEERVLYSKSDNIKIMINHKAHKVIQELFQSLSSRYRIGLETLMKGSDFTFDCFHFLHYKCHKINFK